MPFLGPVDVQLAIEMVIILLISIDVHELAHAFVADALGDPTPRRMGELSLNPLVHMDQIGIILLLITSFVGAGFTYGRTHITPSNLKYGPQRGNAIVAIAGPISNAVLALLLAVVLDLYFRGVLSLSNTEVDFTFLAMQVNILLLIFNLIPIPPLDGFSVLGGFLTARQMYSLAPLQQWGPLIILLVIVFDPGLIYNTFVTPLTQDVLNVICGPSCTG